MRRPRVLVTGTGGSAGAAVINALDGEKFDVFSADVDPHAAGLYLVDEDRRLSISSAGRDSSEETLRMCLDRWVLYQREYSLNTLARSDGRVD